MYVRVCDVCVCVDVCLYAYVCVCFCTYVCVFLLFIVRFVHVSSERQRARASPQDACGTEGESGGRAGGV